MTDILFHSVLSAAGLQLVDAERGLDILSICNNKKSDYLCPKND